MTGGPEGNGADGRFRRPKVGLCVVWLALAATVSLLSPPRRGSDPHRPSYLAGSPRFLRFSFPESSQFCELGHRGRVKGDSAAFPISTGVHVKKPSF